MQQNTALLRMLHRLKQGYAAALRPVERDYGLTRNEIDVLLFLRSHPGWDTARDVAELRGLSKSHVCKSVERLQRRGWLSGRPDKEDRRVSRLTVLPDAAPAVQAAQEAQRAFFQRLYRGVTPEEQEALYSVLDKISKNLEEDSLC